MSGQLVDRPRRRAAHGQMRTEGVAQDVYARPIDMRAPSGATHPGVAVERHDEVSPPVELLGCGDQLCAPIPLFLQGYSGDQELRSQAGTGRLIEIRSQASDQSTNRPAWPESAALGRTPARRHANQDPIATAPRTSCFSSIHSTGDIAIEHGRVPRQQASTHHL
jgi:hypothetical protein